LKGEESRSGILIRRFYIRIRISSRCLISCINLALLDTFSVHNHAKDNNPMTTPGCIVWNISTISNKCPQGGVVYTDNAKVTGLRDGMILTWREDNK
jgi:hypothetical protein